MSAKPKPKAAPAKAAKPKSGAALLRQEALSLPEAAEAPHFDSTSFRVRGKIFATFGEAGDQAVLKLSPELQEAMVRAHPKLFAPVEGYWGRGGWTRVDVSKISHAVLRDVLVSAWASVAPKKLIAAHADELRKS